MILYNCEHVLLKKPTLSPNNDGGMGFHIIYMPLMKFCWLYKVEDYLLTIIIYLLIFLRSHIILILLFSIVKWSIILATLGITFNKSFGFSKAHVIGMWVMEPLSIFERTTSSHFKIYLNFKFGSLNNLM